MRIALVSYTKQKASEFCAAREMYQASDLFRKAVRYIEQNHYDGWYILSAEYGLPHPEDIIEPYDITLNNMPARDRGVWAEMVVPQITAIQGVQYIDFYAGMKYREYLIPQFEKEGIICEVPLKGKGIGEQKKFYKQHIQ